MYQKRIYAMQLITVTSPFLLSISMSAERGLELFIILLLIGCELGIEGSAVRLGRDDGESPRVEVGVTAGGEELVGTRVAEVEDLLVVETRGTEELVLGDVPTDLEHVRKCVCDFFDGGPECGRAAGKVLELVDVPVVYQFQSVINFSQYTLYDC